MSEGVHMKSISYYTKMAFQMSQQICINEGRNIVGTFQYASLQVYKWIKDKFPAMGLPEKVCTYSRNSSTISVDVIYNWENRYFCMKTVHPDTSVPGRTWTTEAEIADINGVLKLGVKNYYSTIDTVQADYVNFSAPAFVWTIYNRIGYKDGELGNGKLILVDGDKEYEMLKRALVDTERSLPIVVVTQNSLKDSDLMKYFEAKDGYLLDGEKLAKDLVLTAHVVYLPTEYSYKLSVEVGKQWSVYDGAVRTYYPGIDFETSDYLEHPLQVAGKIMASCYMADNQKEYIGGHAFRHILTHNLKNHLMNERYDWGDLGYKFFFKANKEILKEKLLHTDNEESIEKEIYEMQISDLETQIDTLNSLLESGDIEIKKLENQVNHLKQNRVYLDIQIYELKKKIKNQKKEIDYPTTYNAMPEWIEENYQAQIYLHPRAVKALKGAEFEDVKLVYQAVQLLAEFYYNKRIGLVTEEEYQKELERLCLKDEKAITLISAGEQGDEYYVTIGEKKHLLERHLTNGVSRDRRYCLRIYYYWDEDRNQVVIGSLPAHLNIRSSN